MSSTADEFDPYDRWLAIPKSEQPPNHYRLLGLQLYESDPDVILNSSQRQKARIKAQAGGRHEVICQRLLSELSLARICLLDYERKAAYDARLRAELRQAAAAQVTRELVIPETVPLADASATDEGAPPIAASQLVPGDEPPAPPVQARWKGAPQPPPRPEADEKDEELVVFKRQRIEGEMDMTPMIDVTFLLLIFFICTASFALQMTKPIPTPQEDEPSTTAQSIQELLDNPDYITVRIDAYNTFRVITPDTDEEAPSFQELIVKLRAARRVGKDGKVPTTLMVIANDQALHEKVVQALDAGTEVGMEEMQLMTVEHDDE